jgi:hypothetical protein
MTDLKQYIKDNGARDIPTLAYLTGIDEEILVGVSEGRLSLGEIHKKAIKKVLPEMPDSLMSPKYRDFPSDIETSKGQIPEGTMLLQIQAEEVQLGDMLLAAHKTSVAGSHWAVVSSIKQQGKNLIIRIGNGIDIGVSKTNLVKVARKRQ